jgi:hypothetical protein
MGGLTLDLRPGAGLGAFNLGMYFFSLTISLEPCESIEKRKTKTKNERKDTIGSIRVFASQVWRIRNSDDVLLIWI